MTKGHASSEAGRRHERPNILLVQRGMPGESAKRLLALSRELGWNLIDNAYRCELWPQDRDPDGAITLIDESDTVDEILKRSVPAVRISNAPLPNDVRIPAVMHDLETAGRMAAEHFNTRSFRKLVFVGFEFEVSPGGIPLYEGFHARATALGLECHAILFKSGRGESYVELYRHRRALVADRLRELDFPVGVFALHDGVARTLFCMCEDAGIAVPEQVALLGRGNDFYQCECLKMTLSSVAPDHVRQTEAAVRLLQRLMDGRPMSEPIALIPPLGVVERESTHAVGTLDRVVNAAVSYLWEHFDVNLSVDDVAREVGVSRSLLERAFRKHLGRGVNAELRRKRLERVCELLRGSDLTVSAIATRTGFGTADYLHECFRRAYGTTPRQYRLQKDAL